MPTDMLALLWAVVVVLASVIAILARVFWKQLEADRKKCAEDRKNATRQTLAFARVMRVVVQHMRIPDGVFEQVLGDLEPDEEVSEDSTERFFKKH